MAQDNLTITLEPGELAAVNHWLSQMSEVDKASTTANAIKQGVKLMQNQGKINLAIRNGVKTGNLKKSFSIKVVRKRGYGLAGFRRTRMSNGQKISGGNHAHLVDRGTLERWTKRPYVDKLGRRYPAGMYRGSVSRGNPQHGSLFWTNAVESQGPKAVDRLIEAVYQSLQEITQRNSR